MAKMTEDQLLSHCQTLEEDSAAFTWGRLGTERETAMKEYFRQPYGTEEEGWSSIVTSEVQDTVEWILPSLLKIFTSTDQAVSFEPSKQEDVKAAEQATDTCNYVFYKSNPGFLTLYTAFKDALLVKNCAVMWRKETKRTKDVTPVQGATAEMLTMLLQEAGDDAEIEAATPLKPQPIAGPDGRPMIDPYTGQPVFGPELYNARICSYKDKTTIKVEAFPPEDLLVKRDWTTPLLDDCPYVARNMRVTLSDLAEMGFKGVTVEDLDSSDDAGVSADASFRQNRANSGSEIFGGKQLQETDDDSLTEGYLRIEFVLVDYDGDGIAERRCVYRLKDKILSNEECAQVPIATASPILIAHRWDGMSVAETVSDLQQLKTELTRQMVNSAYLANNPRTEVLTDSNNAPFANIDDLLDSRPGGILRKSRPDALSQNIVPFVGGQMLPLLGYVDEMGAKRTGVSPSTQMDQNVLRNDRTAVEVQQTANAAAARIDLIARIFAETLLKPIFKGILCLLTDGEMEKVAFRLRNEFVEYDPNEWRDSYDMTINVGLGTGDKAQQQVALQTIFQNQMALSQSPFGPLLVQPKSIYNTQAKLIENAGFKNIGDFYADPKDQQVQPQQPPPDPAVQIAQMKLQAEAQKFQAESGQNMEMEQLKASAKLQEVQANLELQASNDQRDSEREMMTAQHKRELADLQLQLDRYKIDADNSTRITVAQIAHPIEDPNDYDPETGEAMQKPDPMAAITQALAMLADAQSRPKQIVRDAAGRVVGVQ